jgi:hypothetical protein
LKSLLSSTDYDQLSQRLAKGTEYYLEFLKRCNKQMLEHIQQVGRYSGQKSYISSLTEIDQLFSTKIESVQRTREIISMIISGKPWTEANKLRQGHAAERLQWIDEMRNNNTEPIQGKKKSGRVKKKKASKEKQTTTKVSTMETTVSMLKEGLSIEQIATTRGLVRSTIEGHLLKATDENTITMTEWIPEQEIEEMTLAIKGSNEEHNVTALHQALGGKYSYNKIKAVAGNLKSKV